VLISEPGVSRIAVIKGLALRIARGDVIAAIRGKRIMELHVDALVGVPLPPGQFEQCLREVFEAASRNPDVILFIDEIHALVGSGNVASSVELPNVLATALGRGNLQCIGATTIENYERYIASDPLLERCCQPILVHEPTMDEMHAILQQVCPRLEQHHQVMITPDALAIAVTLSAKYLPDKRFPEKALDLMDQACSRARIVQLTQLAPRETSEVEREVTRVAVAEVIAERTGVPLVQVLQSV
jgi:ATP-dependent Clp protease ATP-binding subunit ClpC